MSYGFYQAWHITSSKNTDFVNIERKDEVPAMNTKIDKTSNAIQILIIGDSIAKGTGDEKGKGMGGNLSERLQFLTPKTIEVENAGIDGLKSNDLFQLLQNKNLQASIEKADYILISIGGNDLREIQSIQDSLKDQAFHERQERYLQSLRDSIQRIRKYNGYCQMILVGLYNPYVEENAIENSRWVTAWNNETALLAEENQNVVFLSTYEYFKLNLKRLISADKLHPNAKGYETIGGIIAKSIEDQINR